MKKFLLSILFLLFTSSVGFADTIEIDPNGFHGYEWGTDFETISKDKTLTFLNIADMSKESRYRNESDSKKGFEYKYNFYENRFSSATVTIDDEATYRTIVAELVTKYGFPEQPRPRDNYFTWSLPNTHIALMPHFYGEYPFGMIFISGTQIDKKKSAKQE
jgi:hypothetical protein